MAFNDTPGGGNRFSSGQPFKRGDRPYGKPAGNRPAGGDRPFNRDAKPYGDRPAGDRPFNRDAKPYGDRPARPAGDRPFNRDSKPYGDRPFNRDAKPYGDRPAGDRPFNRDAKPFGDRPARPARPAGERPFNRDAKPYSDRPFNRDAKPYGDRPARPAGDRPFNRDAKPFGDRPASGDRPFNRDAKPYGDRPFNRDAKPYGDRPFNRDAKPYGDRPFNRDAKPYGDRPARPAGDRPFNRDAKPYGDRPFNRDAKPYGDRPARPAGDRPFNRDAKPYGKPYEKPAFDRQEAYKPLAPTFTEPTIEVAEQDEDQLPQIIFGRNTVREAIKSGRSIDRIFVISTGSDDGSLREIVAMAREAKLIVAQVDKSKLDALCMPFGHAGKTANHQGIVAQMPECQYATVEEILEKAKEKNEPPFVLVLDSISDPHNLGSIIRSAECAGVHGVIIPKRRAASVTAAVAKASAGATMYVPVARVANLTQTVEQLKEAGLWIAGADMDGKPMSEVPMKGPLALVIGGEDEGLSRLLKEKCDYIVSIPLAGSITSLNASVSAAVLMYEKRRQDGK